MVAERVAVAVAERAMAAEVVLEPPREIVWLGEPAAEDRSLVGGKVAPLSRLAALHRVPPGFALTTVAFDLARDAATPDSLRLPAALRQQIVAAYHRLAAMTGPEQ